MAGTVSSIGNQWRWHDRSSSFTVHRCWGIGNPRHGSIRTDTISLKGGVHQVLGWSSCLALSNQQACGRPFCFTGRSRPLGTRFSIGSMVLSPWSAPSSLEIPALRVPRCRLAPVDYLLVPLSPTKLPVSYPFFPILALHRFWPYRLLPPTASV